MRISSRAGQGTRPVSLPFQPTPGQLSCVFPSADRVPPLPAARWCTAPRQFRASWTPILKQPVQPVFRCSNSSVYHEPIRPVGPPCCILSVTFFPTPAPTQLAQMLETNPHITNLAAAIVPPSTVRIGVQNEKFTDVIQRVSFSGCVRVTDDHSWRSRIRKPEFVTIAGCVCDQELHLDIVNADGSRESHRSHGDLNALLLDADCVGLSPPNRNDWLLLDDSLFTTREAWLRFCSLVIQ